VTFLRPTRLFYKQADKEPDQRRNSDIAGEPQQQKAPSYWSAPRIEEGPQELYRRWIVCATIAHGVYSHIPPHSESTQAIRTSRRMYDGSSHKLFQALLSPREGASCGEVSGRAAAHPASLISTCAGNSVPATEIADYGVGHPDKSSADRLGRRFEFLRQPFRRATGDYSTLTRHARRHSAGNSARRHVACHHRACANNGTLPDTNPG